MRKKLTMTLLSDTIFGSGMSIPGAEDISVKQDDSGAPYLSGSTLKGLLRQSVENWLDWENNSAKEDIVNALFGEKGSWRGSENSRRVFVSALTLASGQECSNLMCLRTFTSIDERTGTAETGSLRVASCVRKGTVFQGSVTFSDEDQELVESALKCIKYLGTSRTRGFGHVRFDLSDGVSTPAAGEAAGSGKCLRYRVELLENVRVTDLNESHNTFLESLRWIPANTVRGSVLNRLARQDETWFEANKAELLQEVCFTDLIPGNPGKKPAIPVPMGFYENKLGENFYSLPVTGEVRPETKRAKLGCFCTLEEQEGEVKVRSWSPKLGAETRINLEMQSSGGKNPGGLFQSGHLMSGQEAEGRVFFSEDCGDEIRSRVAAALCDEQGELRLGANIHSGLGLCRLLSRVWGEKAPESVEYGYRHGDRVPNKLYMILLSPLMLLDEKGEPRGVDKEWFCQCLDTKVTNLFCATSVRQQQGFNRTLGTRLGVRTCYQRGCVFRIDCKTPPSLERIRAVESTAWGAYQEEGWGRVLFVRDLEQVKGRYIQKQVSGDSAQRREEKGKRRVRAKWLLEEENQIGVRGKLSKSQMGNVQELLTAAAVRPEKAKNMVEERFQHWMSDSNGEKNPQKRNLYTPVQKFIVSVLEGSNLPEGVGEWTERERLEMLIDLIKVSRKEEM